MPRNNPNRVLRTSSDFTINARDYDMVLADATDAAIAGVLISPAGTGEYAIKIKNNGSGDDVNLTVAGSGSFTLALPAGAAVIIEQDDLGELHVFGSSTAGSSIGGLSHISGTVTDVAIDTPDGVTEIGDVNGSAGETTLTIDDVNGTVDVEVSNGMFVNGEEVLTAADTPDPIPAIPTAQDVVDALLTLGIVTQL